MQDENEGGVMSQRPHAAHQDSANVPCHLFDITRWAGGEEEEEEELSRRSMEVTASLRVQVMPSWLWLCSILPAG